MTASMGDILDSDYSAFLPLLIFFSLSLNFLPSNFGIFEAGKPRPSMSSETFGGSQLGRMCGYVGVRNKYVSEVYGSPVPFP